jgi:hypothetical protein
MDAQSGEYSRYVARSLVAQVLYRRVDFAPDLRYLESTPMHESAGKQADNGVPFENRITGD